MAPCPRNWAFCRAADRSGFAMNTVAVVLEKPERLVLSRLDLSAPGRRGRRRRHRVERHQHRHRAAALVGPDAAVPRHGLSAGARIRIGRPRHRRRAGVRQRGSASACSCPARAASATCAACSAAPPRGSSCRATRVDPDRRDAGRAGRAAGAGRDRLSRHRAQGRSPDLIVGHGVLGRLLARIAVAARRQRPTVWERNRRRARAAPTATRSSIRTTTRAATIARSATSAATPRLLDTLIARLAPRGEIVLAGFYSEPLVLRLPAGLHARGAHPRRRRMAAEPISPPSRR